MISFKKGGNRVNDTRIITSIKLNSMDNLKELLDKQRELLTELNKNAEKIEAVKNCINIELSMEKATQ